MKINTKYIFIVFSTIILKLSFYSAFSQCPPSIIGQNLVVNGNFSGGDTGFSSPLASWNNPGNNVPCSNPNPMTCPRFWSGPGEYWVHNNADNFNPGTFSSIPSPGSGGNMMLVDAACVAGGVVWEQTVNVTALSNYYFSVRIASIHPLNPARLSFQVNGVTLGTNVNAPAAVNSWLFYEDLWNSGALSGLVQLRILEQSGVGCTNGDDFAIDDISFIGGCAFGTAGPTPNLGPDRTLCGTPSITLDANVPINATTTVTWNDGTTGSGLGAPYTKIINTPGTYSVCVSDNGSCLRSDVIVITNNYSINLGPDRNLCNPPTVTLNAGFTGPGVTYLWTLNGSPIPAANAQTYVANQAGTYSVQVTDPICGVREDQLAITSSTITANNAQFCAAPSAVNLSVNGSGGTYNWYTAPVGGTLVRTNSTTYTTPPLSATTTYYVEDASSFSYNVGPSATLSGWGRNNNLSNHYLRFDAFSPFVLDFVTVHAYNGWDGNFTVSIVLADNTGAILATSPAVALVGTTNTTSHRIPVGISVPLGTNLRMYAVTSGGQIHYNGNSHPTTAWPYQVAGVMSMHSNISDNALTQNSYNHLYNWEISSGAICARVPVQAVQFCPPACTPPPSAAISNPSPVVMCTAGSVILNANVVPGYQYTWIRNGVTVAGPTVNLVNYTAAQIGTYSVRITEVGSPFCFLQSTPVDVVEFNIGGVNLPADYATCNPAQTLDAIISGTGVTYLWERNAAIIPGANSRTYTINNLGAYRVWVNHPICGVATDVVVVSAGTYSVTLGTDRELCTPTAYTLDAGFVSSGTSYQWQSPIATNIPGASAQTLYVNTPGTYRVVVNHPFCGVQTDDIIITSSSGIPVNDDFCSGDPSNNTASLSVIGAGPYQWFSAQTGGSALTGGNSFTTPVLTGPTTYFVQSNASFKYNKGPKNRFDIINASSAFPTTRYTDLASPFNMSGNTHYIQFTALTTMTFDSVTVYPQWSNWDATITIEINVRNTTTNTDNLVTRTVPNPNIGLGNDANPRNPIRIFLGVPLATGTVYRTFVNSSTNQIIRWQPGSGPLVPINTALFDQAGVVDFTAYEDNGNCDCQYPGFFDFVFSAGVPCDRIPVQAIDLSPCIVAPLNWLSFNATPTKNTVQLNWVTSTEVNNNFFLIQRSLDGVTWETVGKRDGSGTSFSINDYSFTDNNPSNQDSYYRIIQVDYDGTMENSVVRRVTRGSGLQVSILPNPFSENTTVTIFGAADEEIEIEVVDTNGKLVYSKRGYFANQTIEFGSEFASGLYFLKVVDETSSKSYKVLKQ